jgi:tetratricopeptide (TPR) repeat protein
MTARMTARATVPIPVRSDDWISRAGLSRFLPYLPPIALLLLAAIAYIPVYVAGYIWDDSDHVYGNQTLRSLHGLWRMWTVPTSLPQWYPLTHTTFWLEYHLWGANPIGYHIVNVLLHAGGAILLWRLMVKLKIPAAWLAAAFFAVHPIHVESVAWISERKNTLSSVFYFAAALAYLHWLDRKTARLYALALGLFLAALLSKTVTCSLPAALLIVQWWKTGRVTKRDVRPLLPMFLIGLALALTTARLERTHVQAVGSAWTFAASPAGEMVARTLIAGRALWFYAGKLIFPWPLAFIYSRWHIHIDSPRQYLFPAAALMLVIALYLLRSRTGRGPLAAVIYFAITLVPALGYFNIYPMRFSFVADHFQHLASIGLTTLAAVAIYRFTLNRPRARVAISAVLLLALTSLTFAQSTHYLDAETLWRDTLTKTPDSWMVYTNLGRVFESEGRPLDAIPLHEKALALEPNIPDTHENVAVGRMLQGRYDEAEAEFQKALAVNPSFVPAITDLGKLQYFDRHNVAAAQKLFEQALRLSPTYAPAHYAYGVLLEQRGDLEAALEHYRAAAADFPDDFDTEYDLGSVLLKLKRPAEAIAPLRLATQLQPAAPRAWINLRAAYLMAGQPDAAAQAARDAMQALTRDPGP